MIRGYQLTAVCSQYDSIIKPYFRGLYTPDTIDSAVRMIDANKPNFLIFNSDFSHNQGSHWLGVFVDLENESYFIDTFAHHPNYYHLERFWAEVTGDDYKTLPRVLQSKYTTVCGLWCLYWGHWLCAGLDMEKILKKLPNSTNILTDQHILNWFNENFGSMIKLESPWIDCSKLTNKAEKQKCKQYKQMLDDRKV